MQNDLPVRKLPRLSGYDYSLNGAYFVTLCTKDRSNLFGKIIDEEMCLNECGRIAENELLNVAFHYDKINIDKFVIMPNHIHAIVMINPTERMNPAERINPFPTKIDLPNVIGKYKAGVTRTVGNAFMRSGIWQKSYYDHIIRNQEDYNRIWQYIDENPAKWAEDKFYTDN